MNSAIPGLIWRQKFRLLREVAQIAHDVPRVHFEDGILAGRLCEIEAEVRHLDDIPCQHASCAPFSVPARSFDLLFTLADQLAFVAQRAVCEVLVERLVSEVR